MPPASHAGSAVPQPGTDPRNHLYTARLGGPGRGGGECQRPDRRIRTIRSASAQSYRGRRPHRAQRHGPRVLVSSAQAAPTQNAAAQRAMSCQRTVWFLPGNGERPGAEENHVQGDAWVSSPPLSQTVRSPLRSPSTAKVWQRAPLPTLADFDTNKVTFLDKVW